MKYDTKYCFIDNKGKNYQLILTQPYPNTTLVFEQIVAHTRFLLPLGTIASGIVLGLSAFSGVLDPTAFEFFVSFLVSTGFCYFPNASFPVGISTVRRNNKILKTLQNFYDEMRSLEFDRLSRKISDNVCLKEQQKLAKNMLKLFAKYQNIDLRLAVKYERKLEQGKGLTTTQAFAYGQIETAILTIDKFIFHNYLLLKELCPEYEDFISDRVDYYNSKVISRGFFTDEIVRVGLKRPNYYDTFVNDDILHRENEYPSELCSKFHLSYEKLNVGRKIIVQNDTNSQSGVTTLDTKNNIRRIQQYQDDDDATDLQVIVDENEN